MGNFTGGSADAMAQQVADGFLRVTERSFKRLSGHELGQLACEIDRLLQEVRGDPPTTDDLDRVRRRNRQVERLNTCRMMLETYCRRHCHP